jgi:hypothetical protein
MLAVESLTACATPQDTLPNVDAPPAATGSAAPAQPKRRESKEPSTKDPSLRPPTTYRRLAVIDPERNGYPVLVAMQSRGAD